jgi:hypothetical protein
MSENNLSVYDATKGPFTPEWFEASFKPKERATDKIPDREACVRLADVFNQACASVVESYALPLFLRPVRRGVRSTALDERTWARYVFDLGGALLVELNKANPGRKFPFGCTPKGRVVQILKQAILLISQEDASPGAIAKELERQRRRSRAAPVTPL